MFTLYTKPVPLNQKFFISRGRNILSSKYRDAKHALAQETRLKWIVEPHRGIVEMVVRFYFGDKRKRDVDAYVKILLDSMQGIVYEDDNQVHILHLFKHYDKDNPRTEVEITSN